MENLVLLALLAVAGFLAQLVDGSLGMGYGITSSTILIFIGLSPRGRLSVRTHRKNWDWGKLWFRAPPLW